ncbi:MAG: class I SAM-dependent methyltransferase [Nanoarchaeota archaeon]|nr:class I SAM-dependent methyltransferase [Nanoarchaeota archaeon]MBU1030631.1 class I SAM-dependent methyltransferase [Nanoarchaeota archaeon]MBU1849549.1 class I SAM-dependent methyltransferase [Nanoarchaeota archaeon]
MSNLLQTMNNYYSPGKNYRVDSWIEEWTQHTYPTNLKEKLIAYDNKNLLGHVVLDLGCGPKPLSFNLSEPKRAILVDVVPMIKSLKSEHFEVVSLWSDIDELLKSDEYKFLDDYGPIDTVIASSIFNYVDWKKLLSEQSKIQAFDGYLFIANMTNRGVPRLFSKKRPISTDEIIYELLSCGYELKEKTNMNVVDLIVAQKVY